MGTSWRVTLIVVILQSFQKACFSVTCPSGYTNNGNVCYKYHMECSTWDNALRMCHADGATLYKAGDQESFMVAQSISRTIYHNKGGHMCEGGVWLGGRRTGGQLKWEDGTSAEGPRSFYASGQPDALNGEDCVEIRNKFGDLLNDHDCSITKEYICQKCHLIDHCDTVQCPTPAGTTCQTCHENNVFYKKSNDRKHCLEMCSINKNFCWPGNCNGTLNPTCRCDKGFTLDTNNGGHLCQLSTLSRPSITSCFTTVIDKTGKMFSSKPNTSSNACDNMQDFYGNIQPTEVKIELLTDFTIKVDSSKPSFVKESFFGITDTSVHFVQKSITGQRRVITSYSPLVDSGNSQNVNGTVFDKRNTSISVNLRNGESLCVTYEAKAGGYLIGTDTRRSTHTDTQPLQYKKTTNTREICYIYDDAKPEHNSSTIEPLKVDHRITDLRVINLSWQGWTDPLPRNGAAHLASGIQFYEISVNEVIPSKDILKVDTKNALNPIKYNNTVTSMALTLPLAKSPKLYCINLEVKDFADNVKHARRFVLYDNSSSLQTGDDNLFEITTATKKSDNQWQTNHEQICVTWRNFFFNTFYRDNSLLLPIEKAPFGQINGKYDQEEGDIPVIGTPNVDGVIKFNFIYKVNDEGDMGELTIDNMTEQSHCFKPAIRDGQTYLISIKATDIMNNTITANRTVHIDRSAPHIANIWLSKNGYKSLFVHDQIDLSTMDLTFEAFDSHSGIEQVFWSFGITDSGSELASGNLAVRRTIDGRCANYSVTCYCPSIGRCEEKQYRVPLNRLTNDGKHKGNHNRNYFFTIKVTNLANLSNIEHVDILVDDSPPETGVVYEGSTDSQDIDYTSADSFQCNWHGFIDHESGIKLYRVVVSDHCSAKDDFLENKNDSSFQLYEFPFYQTSAILNASFSGKMFVSVVAINNAMQASKPACSDGIIRDNSFPQIRNITLQYGQWTESLLCKDGTAWLLQKGVTKLKLKKSPKCLEKCKLVTHTEQIFDLLKETRSNVSDADISEFLCETLPLYSETMTIYLPNNHLSISWDIGVNDIQINNYFVGIGIHINESDAPSIMDFTPTNRKSYFKRNQVGLNGGYIFYVFIKALNKASKQQTFVIGPVIIDETPPNVLSSPEVVIEKQYIVVGWKNDTFYDGESGKIIQLFFQIVSDDKAITPFMEWAKTRSEPCKEFSGGCFKYPLRQLQNHDTENGLHFVFKLDVFNKAGHSVRTETKPFRVPSRFPPGQAIIVDLDPEVLNAGTLTDVTAHFTNNTLCARWTGFHHHENVSIEFGVGSSPGIDDVLSFHPVDTSLPEVCVSSDNITLALKYFSVIKAYCSGGSTTSSSNGVVILNETEVVKSLNIHVGTNCKIVKTVNLTTIAKGNDSYCLSQVYLDGKTYLLTFTGTSLTLNISSESAHVERFREPNVFKVTPYDERPCLTILTNGVPTSDINIEVSDCFHHEHAERTTALDIHWEFNSNSTVTDTNRFTYKISLLSIKDNESSLETLVYNTREHFYSFKDLRLVTEKKYVVHMLVCTNVRCIQEIASEEFKLLDQSAFTGRIEISELSLFDDTYHCLHLNLSWKEFESKHGVIFYRWRITGDQEGKRALTAWNTITTVDKELYEVDDCLNLSVHGYSKLFACVNGFSRIGQSLKVCKELSVISSGGYATDTVYEYDASSDNWSFIKSLLHSSNLGPYWKNLHDGEMNFGTPRSKVSGLLMYATERVVTFFLMKSQRLPAFDTCDYDSDCLQAVSSHSGYAFFNTELIAGNKIHYLCAYSNDTILLREGNQEHFEEVRSCGNGFIIDNQPPSSGTVSIKHHKGFLSDFDINVRWKGFGDGVEALSLGYIDDIKHYSYAVGTRTKGEDIFNFTDVGQDTSVILSLPNIKDGTSIYVSVKATDHAGLSTIVSSEEVVMDTSPPHSGTIIIVNGLEDSNYISSSSAKVLLKGFRDDVSGISHFKVGIGTSPGFVDIVRITEITTDDFDLTLKDLQDGISYYINVQAINKAGLLSNVSSTSFVPDRSPPNAGTVLDGNWNLTEAHWKNFYDLESKIEFYRVGLGTKPLRDNVVSMVNIGLRTDIVWRTRLTQGQRYYTTVEACNFAGLCSSACSDGIFIDNSPPITGLVRVGSGSSHQKYQASRNAVHIKWVGFEDPQSGIDHFEACFGSAVGSCDITTAFPCLLQSSVIKTGLNLPSNKNIYTTVFVYNKAGMKANASSDAFRIDNTPPTLIQNVSFLQDVTAVPGFQIQYDRSVIRVSWKFDDPESSVSKHIVSLMTHHDGHIPIDHIHVGNVNSLTIRLDKNEWLNDGDKYYVIVTCCNFAGLCSTSQSEDLLIDSTPPHLGGFMSPMTWTNNEGVNQKLAEINLTWYGFVDQESGIENYYIAVAKTFGADDMLKSTFKQRHNPTSKKQQATIDLSDNLFPGDKLILTIWSSNNAGLNSSIARVTAIVLSTETGNAIVTHQKGELEIEKHSCDIHFCNNDCTCAVIGQPCSTNRVACETPMSTEELQKQNLPLVDVFTGLQNKHSNITASSNCLAGHWSLRASNDSVHRYEWSLGILSEKPGFSVLDPMSRPFQDIGKNRQAVLCLPKSRALLNNTYYVVYVKVWYSAKDFAVFSSDPILTDHSPPQRKKGNIIKDTDIKCKAEFDVIDWMDTITACWDNVFSEQQGNITHYELTLGTSVNGSDILSVTNVGLVTQFTLNNLSLHHGTKYYFTVTAYNNVGLHTSAFSDGFIVDMDNPVAGVVFNTNRHKNVQFQSSVSQFAISWHGFQDSFSGIRTYYVAMASSHNLTNLKFIDVGLQTSHVFDNLQLRHQESYVGIVKAVDAVGHASISVMSQPKSIDISEPRGFSCKKYENVDTLYNVSSIINFRPVLIQGAFYNLSGIVGNTSAGGKVNVRLGRSSILLPLSAHNNHSGLFYYPFNAQHSGILETTITTTSAHTEALILSVNLELCLEKVVDSNSAVHVRHIDMTTIDVMLQIEDLESSITELAVGSGTTPGGFQLHPLTRVNPGNIITRKFTAEHGTKVYVTAIAENGAGLRALFSATPIVIDKTPPEIVSIQTKTIYTSNDTLLKEGQNVLVSWIAKDAETGLLECHCYAGHSKGVQDIVLMRPSDNDTFCRFSNLFLQHGATFFAAVKCTNKIGLSSESFSDPITISYESAKINNAVLVPVGSQYGNGMLADTTTSGREGFVYILGNRSFVHIEWIGFEDASGIDHYEYRFLYNNETIIDWKNTGRETEAILNGLKLEPGRTYVTQVRAVNFGGHFSDNVHASVMVLAEQPKLTGLPVIVLKNGERCHIDWSQVFEDVEHIAVTYDVSVGSQDGFNDIIDLQRISVASYDVNIPAFNMMSPVINELFLSITCFYSTDSYNSYKTTIKL